MPQRFATSSGTAAVSKSILSRDGLRRRSQEKKPAANRIHPTAKPVELVERAILNSSKSGDIVVDLFGASGSTLIGCERRGRKARLMEIDPKYRDCIIRRFQEYTGKKAI